MKYKPLIPEVIVIHCSATPASMDIGRKEIDFWHREKGWFAIGYHYVIRRDGTVEEGRDEKRPGAHARGHNHNSLGVCLVGGLDKSKQPEDNFTDEQYLALEQLLMKLVTRHDIHTVCGHNDLPNVKKACPCFDVTEWLSSETDVKRTIAQNVYQNSLNYDE